MSKKAALKKAYQRERKRVLNYLRRREKAGFLTSFTVPKIPKRITQGSINRLKKLTPKFLKSKETMFLDYETGEVFESKNHAELVKIAKGARSGKQTVTDDFIDYLEAQGLGRQDYQKLPKLSDIIMEKFSQSLNFLPSDLSARVLDSVAKSVEKPDKWKVLDEINNILSEGSLTVREYYKLVGFRDDIGKFFDNFETSDSLRDAVLNFNEGMSWNEDMVF